MKRSIIVAGAGTLALAGGVLAAPVAHAEERVCRGTLGAITVDNLRVPAGASCTLIRTTVKGTVKVERNARLATSVARIVGNVQAEGHAHVGLSSTTVGGSVQLKQGRTASLRFNQVKGDIQSFSNRGAQYFQNNRVNGNLQCKSNVPAPTGSGNIVGGNKEDQCRRL
jgi:DUF4097 and DUF4098 domain-containing protein YvlB